ncbi:MAG: RHS repeat-associated core domain-containing protein [Candidatus Neoclostridium sp.]
MLDERIAYDNAGRPIIYRNNAVEWNGSQMTKYGGNTYEYDGNNYRVFKQTPSEKTYYCYDGFGNLRFERRGRTEINYIYDAGGIRGMKVTVPTDDPSTYYVSSEFCYVKDSLGNVRVILDKSGNIMVEYNYDAWGNFEARSVGNANIGGVTLDLVSLNAFTYRGYYYDKESGLYYLINRYYDPVTGRFISPDDVGYLDFESFFGTNRYAYCLDNPVNYIDPEGHSLVTVFLILAATTIIGVALGAKKAVDEGAKGWGFAKDVILGAAFGLAMGGAIVSIFAVFAGAIGGSAATVFWGVAVKQAFAIGALAIDFTAFVVAPLFGIVMQGIEYETPQSPYQPPANIPTPPHPYNKLHKRTRRYDI